MTSLTPIFQALYEGVKNGDPRYRIIGEESLVDDATGLEYHFHTPTSGKPWEVYYQEAVLITGKHMTPEEVKYLQPIANKIGDFFTESQRDQVYNIWASVETEPTTTTSRL